MGDNLIGKYSKDVIEYLSSAPLFQDWYGLRQILLERLADDEPWMHALPVLSCLAVGGDPGRAIPVAAAWTMMYHAANIIDEVQDGEIKPDSDIQQPGIAIPASLSLIFAAFQTLNNSTPEEGVRNPVIELFTQAGFLSSLGQYRLTIQSHSHAENQDPLENQWSNLILKSGSIYRAGVAGGAVVGSGTGAQIEGLGDYGVAVGVIRQVIDDCCDIWVDTLGKTRKTTLPLLLYKLVSDQLLEQEEISEPGFGLSSFQASEDTSKLLVDAGIPEMIAEILLEWRRRAVGSLDVLDPSPVKNILVDIIGHILNPNTSVS